MQYDLDYSPRMRITILGSGTSVPAVGRRPPAFLLQAAGKCLLIDCGAGSTTALMTHGVTVDALDGVLITHLHPDHTAELLPLLFALKNPLGPTRRRTLDLYGPMGLRAHLEALGGVYGDWIAPRECEVEVHELAVGEARSLEELSFVAHAVEHSGPCFAYRVEAGERSICFSGDSGPCPALTEAAQDVDLFVCECAAMEEEAAQGHMSATSVGRTAAEAGCRRVVLTHLYEHVVASEPVDRVKALFSGDVLLGSDDLVLLL